MTLDYSTRVYTNRILQSQERTIDFIRDHLFDGSGAVTGNNGMLVKVGATAEKVVPCTTNDRNALGIIIGNWDSNGVYDDSPPTTTGLIADLQKVRVAYLQSGIEFLALFPNGVTAARGEKLKTAPSGRVTNIDTTPTALVTLAVVVQSLVQFTASADDKFSLVRCL